MARPSKTGLDYYNIDTDLFQNRKVKRLIKTFCGKGFMIYSFVLNEIYRDNGCFIVWDSNTAFDVSDTLNVSENLVKEVIDYCGVVGLFNAELLSREGILTSKNIQERWEKISKDARRSVFQVSQIEPKFSLTHVKTELITVETTLIPEETKSKATETPQSKVKESKGKEIKYIGDTAKAEKIKSFKTLTEKEFGKSLEPFIDEFSKETIRAFYNYWSEKSPSGKMLFQLKPTWDTKRRLTTWKGNEPKFGTNTSETTKPKRRQL